MSDLGAPPPRGHWAKEQLERHFARTIPTADPAGEGQPLRTRVVAGEEPNDIWAFGYGHTGQAFMFYSARHDAAYLVAPNSLGGKTLMKWVDGALLADQKLLEDDDPVEFW